MLYYLLASVAFAAFMCLFIKRAKPTKYPFSDEQPPTDSHGMTIVPKEDREPAITKTIPV
jgi:phage terminase large subunit-like protein